MEDIPETYNFSAGPACLPKEVLLKAQEETLNWHGTGYSVMEMSHRSKEFAQIMDDMVDDFRQLMEVPEEFDILLLPAGASMQFSAIPMNLLTKNKKANYLVFGTFGKSAIHHARRYDTDITEVVDPEKLENSIPDFSTWKIDPDAKYFHYWDNETLYGMEINDFPFEELKGQTLVCDMSSNICSRKVDWSKYGLVYAVTTKNIGPSGICIVVIRKDLIEEPMKITPDVVSYKKYADAPKKWFNTPWTWAIYVSGLNLKMMREKGMEAIEQEAELKSQIIYEIIDNSDGFYINEIEKKYRSRMNVVFYIKGGPEVEAKFVEEGTKNGLASLKGHKTVGGLRASIYNAMPIKGVEKLAEFMKKFQEENS